MDALLTSSSPGAPSKLTIGKNVSVGTRPLQNRFGALTSLETDFLSVASVIYAADLAVKRNEREDFVRTIELKLPVVNLAAFNAVKAELEQILRVLSCDNWTLRFQAAVGTPEPNRKWPKTKGTTLLFSGGLDSFAGACDLLKHGEETFLVSHITHNRPVADSQKKLVSAIEHHYRVSTSHMPLMVSCRTNRNFPFPQDSLREETQRTRSFLFVALAAVAARLNGSRRILVMAENGQFAIHLPLTAARVGAFSTHTAHPEFLRSMETVLRGLLSCPDLTLRNPFEHKTKSEVVELIPTKLRPGIEKSISCWMTARLTQYSHCGECIPCISRRLALEAHNIKFKEYKRDMFRADIGSLPPDDAGKRNLTDMLEFIARFHGPHAMKNEQDLAVEFPELFNPFVDRQKTIAMYRRFAKSATQVLTGYPAISGLLKVRLRLSELERARKRPKAVAAAQFQPGKGIRPTFGGYWVLAARLYHKLFKMNDALCVQKAHDYFLQHCRAKLMNRANFDHEIALYSGRLDDYIADYLTLNQPVVQTNKRVQFKKITGHFVSGAIGRLDMIPAGGFAATNFELKPSDWKSQLRTPIIQQAIADELNRPSSEIRVGMYCIASGNHEYVTLSAGDIQQAIAELENVLNTVETEVKRLKRSKP